MYSTARESSGTNGSAAPERKRSTRPWRSCSTKRKTTRRSRNGDDGGLTPETQASRYITGAGRRGDLCNIGHGLNGPLVSTFQLQSVGIFSNGFGEPRRAWKNEFGDFQPRF